MNLNFIKALAITTTIIIATLVFSFDAHSRSFQRAVTNGNSDFINHHHGIIF